MKRFISILLGSVLVFSLVPGVAFAEEMPAQPLALVEGTYEEHEVIACVVDESLSSDLSPLESSLLDGATPLMTLSSETIQYVAEGIVREDEGVRSGVSSDSLSALAENTAATTGTLCLIRDESKTTAELIAELEQDSRVLYAEPNWMVEPSDEEAATGPLSTASDMQTLATLGDLTRFQWGFNNSETMGGAGNDGGGTSHYDINYSGWNTSSPPPSQKTVVAILDSGIDADHPDLRNMMWGNGRAYTSLTNLGGDAYGFSAAPNPSGYADPSGVDEDGHGTHCAGIVAAEWNNQGTSGVSEHALLMALKHNNNLVSIIDCFEYLRAAQQEGVNVKVVSCSWGMGSTQVRTVDTLVTEAGLAGIIGVFASANDYTNIDLAATTATTLKDNPYAIVVNSMDATGIISCFSNYGVATTDIMSPGTTILSTYPTNQSSYMGEADDAPVLYESFESATPTLTFASGARETNIGGKRFDGDCTWRLTYDPSAPDSNLAVSSTLDLSASKPKYLSIRYTAADYSTVGDFFLAQAQVVVETSTGPVTLEAKGTFMAAGDAWGGGYFELPDNTDYANFKFVLAYGLVTGDFTGGMQSFAPLTSPADILIDSIGLGSSMVPYAYEQGTSMACPAVAGVAATLAQYYGDSAIKLAARVKGAAVRYDQYNDLCLTGGLVSIDTADAPAPVVTSFEEDGDSLIISGYFFGNENDVEVTVGGLATTRTSAVLGSEGFMVVTIEKPQGLTGGNTEVTVSNKSVSPAQTGRYIAHIGKDTTLAYYDQIDLPYFDELLTWDAWQLVGYNGLIYCLPHASASGTQYHESMWCYTPATRTWTEIALPVAEVLGAGLQGGILNVSGATWREKLTLQFSDLEGNVRYWLYGADGSWQQLALSFTLSEVPLYASLASDGDMLYLFGGIYPKSDGTTDSTRIYKIDTASGTATQIGALKYSRVNPQVSYRAGSFVVSGGESLDNQTGGSPGVEYFSWSGGGLVGEMLDFSNLVDDTGQLNYASGPTATGFIFAGPTDATGGSDTYLLNTGVTTSTLSHSAEGQVSAFAVATPTAYGKCADDTALLIPAATAYNGVFYVLAASAGDPYRVFSATAVSTVFQPGDYGGFKPTPTPTPSPNVLPATGDTLNFSLWGSMLLCCVLLFACSRLRKGSPKEGGS